MQDAAIVQNGIVQLAAGSVHQNHYAAFAGEARPQALTGWGWWGWVGAGGRGVAAGGVVLKQAADTCIFCLFVQAYVRMGCFSPNTDKVILTVPHCQDGVSRV